MITEAEQLKDVVIIITSVEYGDDDKPYSVTHIRRYDLEGSSARFVAHLETSDQLIDGGQIGVSEVIRGA